MARQTRRQKHFITRFYYAKTYDDDILEQEQRSCLFTLNIVMVLLIRNCKGKGVRLIIFFQDFNAVILQMRP